MIFDAVLIIELWRGKSDGQLLGVEALEVAGVVGVRVGIDRETRWAPIWDRSVTLISELLLSNLHG